MPMLQAILDKVSTFEIRINSHGLTLAHTTPDMVRLEHYAYRL